MKLLLSIGSLLGLVKDCKRTGWLPADGNDGMRPCKCFHGKAQVNRRKRTAG